MENHSNETDAINCNQEPKSLISLPFSPRDMDKTCFIRDAPKEMIKAVP